MSEKLFSEKIKYLNEKLKLKPKEFTKLFWDGDRKKFSSRHNTVHKSWLGKGISQVKGFYFDEWGISNLILKNGEFAFTEYAFMYGSFEEFKNMVDNYVSSKEEPKDLFEYKYIYYYNNHKKLILSSRLIVLEKINNTEADNKEYRIKLVSFNFQKDKEVEIYRGKLRVSNGYYHISVKNGFEILTLYFVVGRGYGKKRKVNGIGLGLTYDSGLPQSTKQLLTKEKLSSLEQNDFYLIANEMEYICSDESLFPINSDNKKIYIKYLHKRIDALSNYIRKANFLLEDTLIDDIYLSIFNEIFNRFYEISKKVQNKQDFFIFRRRNSIESFLKNISTRDNSFCTIVYPLFGNDTDLFDKTEERCKGFLELNIQLVKDGLQLNRIFVIDEEYKITKYFINSIKRLRTAGTNIKIAWKKDIEKLNIGSYDFVLSKEKDVALYKNVRDQIHIYYVTQNKEEIQSLFYDYQKINEISFNFEFLLSKRDVGDEVFLNLDLGFSKKHLNDDNTLALLVGKWNFYSYGSVKNKNNEFKLWHDTVNIYSDRKVSYIFANQEHFLGYINTEYNKYQAFIYLSSLDFDTLSIITMTKQDISKNIFKVSMIDKQVGTNYDMATFGIFSKIELDEKVVKDLLGNIDEVMLRESIALEQRINKFYHESKF